jgi:N-acetylmuramoyl-L-alanine amidase
MKIIVLDAGHGGADPGAVNGKHAIREAHMALDVVLRAERLLKQVSLFKVILTRRTDKFLTLSERPAIANRRRANLFVSYHFNAAGVPTVPPSWEIYTTHGQNKSDELATCIGRRHEQHLGHLQKARKDLSDGDLDKEARYAVIRRTYCPAVLMEGEFIDTDAGAELIKNPANRELMALAVAQGICDYFGHDSSVIAPQAQKA